MFNLIWFHLIFTQLGRQLEASQVGAADITVAFTVVQAFRWTWQTSLVPLHCFVQRAAGRPSHRSTWRSAEHPCRAGTMWGTMLWGLPWPLGRYLGHLGLWSSLKHKPPLLQAASLAMQTRCDIHVLSSVLMKKRTVNMAAMRCHAASSGDRVPRPVATTNMGSPCYPRVREMWNGPCVRTSEQNRSP